MKRYFLLLAMVSLIFTGSSMAAMKTASRPDFDIGDRQLSFRHNPVDFQHGDL